MRTMSGGPCLHYDCSNRSSFGYCKTTACINHLYNREWIEGTTTKSSPAIVAKQTNADRIRNMSDEELAEYLANIAYDLWAMFVADPRKMWLEWLRQESEA